MSDRVYSLCRGHGEGRTVLRWGISRFGDRPDPEMEAAVSEGCQLGRESLYIEWTPKRLNQRSPEQMQAQRVGNARRRAERKFPLFAEVFLEETLAKDKFTMEACEQDHAYRAKVDSEWQLRWWRQHPEDRRVTLC